MSKRTVAQVPTTVRALREWIAPVVQTIGADDMLPVLCHARIEVGGHAALMTSTDRFRASLSRIRIDAKDKAVPSVTVHVHRDALKQVLAAFPIPRRRSDDPTVVVAVMRDRVRFIAPGHTVEVQTLECANEVSAKQHGWDRVPEVNYPDVRSLFATAARSTSPTPSDTVGVNFHFLAAFRVIAPKREAAVIRQSGGPSKPLLIRMGDDYLGLLMPRRVLDGSTDAPPITEGWDDLLTPTKENA